MARAADMIGRAREALNRALNRSRNQVARLLHRPPPSPRDGASTADSLMLSVILPIFDSDPDHLGELLETIHDQGHSEFECIIVDDGSTDSRGVDCAERMAARDKRFIVRRRSENGGIAAATNDALDHAIGDWVLFCDHDDLILPGAFEKIAEHIAGHPDDDLVYTDEVVINARGERIVDYRKPDFSAERLLGQNYICHIVTARRSLVEEIGGLDARFEPVADNDFDMRAATAARHVGHIPEILYAWRSTPGSLASGGDAKSNVSEAVVASATAHLERRQIHADASPSPHGPTLVRIERPAVDTGIAEIPIDHFRTAGDINAAITAATAQYVALAPPKSPARWFEPLAALCAEPHVSMVGPKLVTADGRVVTAGRIHHPALTDLYQGVEEDNPGPWGAFCINREVASVAATGAVFRRADVLDLGGFSVESLVKAISGAGTLPEWNDAFALEPALEVDIAMALLGTALWLRDKPVIWSPLVTLTIDESAIRSEQYWASLAQLQGGIGTTVPALLADPYSPVGVRQP